MLREIVVAAVSFSAGFLLAGIFAIDSYRKGYKDGERSDNSV
jgi:hypothetical protein